MAKRRPSFVTVLWTDARSTAEWVDPRVDPLPAVVDCISRGWLLVDDDNQVTLAATLQLDGGEGVGEILSIPRGMVKSITQFPGRGKK